MSFVSDLIQSAQWPYIAPIILLIGSAVYSPAELKTIQQVVTLIVFAGFPAVYFDEPLSWTQASGFGLDIALGASLVFHGQA